MQDTLIAVSNYFARLTGLTAVDETVDVFESGLVNSLAVIQMISFVEKEFRIRVELDDLDRENFRSIRAVTEFVDRKRPVRA